MDHSPKKALNRVKDSIKRERESPAQHDQSSSPFGDAIRTYWEREMLTFSIPAHNGGRGPAPEFTHWAGAQVARADLPVTHGIDTRNASYQVQARAQELFADAVGARQTLFSTGGSSLSARVAIMTVAGPGDEIVMARNGHKSAWAGLIISGAHPVWVEPFYDEELELAHGVSGEAMTAALDSHPAACAAMIFTPTYYGTSADVAELARVAHAHDVPLVTDDAWGLDYAFGGPEQLPAPALHQGADLAIGSVHKTLTGLSQTSVLSVGSERIDTERLQLCFELQESTSSSALLLSSIDGARAQFVRDGPELMARALDAAAHLRERLAAEVPELPVVSPETLTSRPPVTACDPTHVLIETGAIGLTGYTAIDWLREHHRIDVELIDHRRIMPLLSFAHGPAEIDRLVGALRELVDDKGVDEPVARLPSRPAIRSEQVQRPRDAFFGASEMVDAGKAAGRVSAELVTPYPPGIPAVAPGERYTEGNLAYLEAFVEAGGFVEGAADPTLARLRVVAAP